MPYDNLLGVMIAIAVVFVIVPLAVAHSTHKTQELSETWRKLAARHRLDFHPGGGVNKKVRVSGRVRGHEFVLERTGGGKNAVPVHMVLRLEGSLPDGLKMEPVKAIARDEPAALTADDPEAMATYLTAKRAVAAHRLAERGGEVDDRRLKVQVNKRIDDLEALDATLRVLADVAPVLDGS